MDFLRLIFGIIGAGLGGYIAHDTWSIPLVTLIGVVIGFIVAYVLGLILLPE